MADLRPDLDPIFSAFGVEATITPLGGAPIVTRAVWVLQPANPPGSTSGADRPPRLAVRRDTIPDLPAGSTILAPPLSGGPPQLWTVARVDATDSEVFRAVVG